MYVDGAFRVAQISGFMNTQETEDVNEAVNERIFCRLLTNSGGTFSNAPLQATLGIILELVSKSCHNEVLGLGYRTGIPDLRDKDVGNLISILESACQWTLRRIRAGNTHFKPYYFLACYLKYVSAVQQGARGALFEERVLAGAADCAEACLAELKAIAEKQGLATKAAEHQQPRESHPLSATSFPLDTDLSIPEMEVDLDLVGFMSTWPFIDTSGISNTAGSDDRENMWL
jgi:hypothetical protein